MDRKTLETWLKTRPREDAIAIAQRAALRVMPLWGGSLSTDRAHKRDLTTLPVLWAILTSGVARKFPTPEVKAAAQTARTAIAALTAAHTADAAAVAALTARIAALTVADAASAARSAALTADAAVTAAVAARTAVLTSVATVTAFWGEIERDVATLTAGQDLSLSPLWHGPIPERLAEAESTALTVMTAEYGSDTSFWHRWWAGAKIGNWLNWDLQRDIALIPDEVWKSGIGPVMAEIARIEAGYAFATTDNGEDVERNPETGKLYLVPKSALPADLGVYIRRKITKAVGLFDGQDASQMYGALESDLDMLRAAVADAENMPMELYDVCASASRRLLLRAERGECPGPDRDALIGDYHQRIVDAAHDVLSHDPMARDVLDRRNRQSGNDVLVQGAELVAAGTAIVLPATEGRLSAMLPIDGQTATDPKADGEDRKAAGFRWAGRMLRIMKWAGGAVAVGGLAKVGELLIDLGLSPASQEVLKQVWTMILRYIGLG